MFLNAPFTLLLLGILTPVFVTGQECGPRNISAAGGSCERACRDGGTCRKENRECVCDGLCGLSCLKKACPLLQSPIEGYVTVTPSQHYIGAIAEYRCNTDFTLVGNSNRTCQSDKTWSGSEPVCRELSDSAPVLAETHHCNFLAFPSNGVVAYYEEIRIEGVIATYRCDDGYTLTGNKNRTCLREGSWSGSEPDCVLVSCPDVNIQDGHVHREEVNRVSREGDEITFSCNEGFQLRYPQRRRCAEDGHWVQTIPICEAVNCGDLENPINGLKIGDDVSYGSEVSFRCRVGYILEGTESVICQTDGSWSGPLPTCNEIRCPAPDVRSNVRSDESLPEYPYQSTVRFYCEDGYVVRGPSEITCNSNEQWSDIPPICVAICDVRLVHNGNLHYMNDTVITRQPRHGDRVTVRCYDGFTISDVVENITCVNGVWNHILPTCVEAKCLAVSSMDYFTIFYNGASSSENEFDPNTELEVTCRDGLFPDRTESSICRKGQWSPSIPRCTSIANCQPVLDEEGREIEYFDDRSYVHGSNLTVSCDNDTVLIGSMTSRCDNGTWNPPVGKCLVNVAKNKRAYQGSSAYRDSGADLAVNGLKVEEGRCSQTHTTNQWWFVDLGANFAVREIQIYHHDDPNALLNVEVRVGQEAGSEINQNTLVGRVTDVSSNPVRITVNGNVEGRFVSVDHTGSSDPLVLCEVQIFGDLLGDPCDNGCVVPKSLANGRYGRYVRSSNNYSTIDPGSCFRDIHLSVSCNPDDSLIGSHFYTCDQTTGKFDYRNTGHREILSYCGSSCPRPQINPNVLYFVGENNDPIGDRTAFHQDEEIYSKCEDPRYQLHVGPNIRRCQRGTWTGSAPRCDISQLHMDISPTTSLTISPSGQFVLVIPIDEVTISCRNRLNSAQLSEDTLIRKNSEDTQGERPDDTSVYRLVIINPTAEDSGIYTCLSSGLSHSINVTFEDHRCSRPHVFPNIIAHVGVGEDTTTIENRQSFMGGETITFRCEDVRYQILDGPIRRQCIDGEWTERAPRCDISQLKVGVDNTILKTVSPDGTFIVYPIVGSVFINCQLRTGGRIGNSATITTNSTTQPSQRAYIAGKLKRLRLRNPTSGNDGTYTCESGTQRHSIRIKYQDIRCPSPGNVSNGRWAYVRATGNRLIPHAYILNEKVTLQCYLGYHPSSNQESRCHYQGQWSPPLSSCIADYSRRHGSSSPTVMWMEEGATLDSPST